MAGAHGGEGGGRREGWRPRRGQLSQDSYTSEDWSVGSVIDSWGCQNKVLQAGWLKQQNVLTHSSEG